MKLFIESYLIYISIYIYIYIYIYILKVTYINYFIVFKKNYIILLQIVFIFIIIKILGRIYFF